VGVDEVGKLYLQTAIDCHSRYAWARLYPNKLPVTAVQLLRSRGASARAIAQRTAVTLISTRSPGARSVPMHARHGQPSVGIQAHQTASISALVAMSAR
jgi:hypothetical protein